MLNQFAKFLLVATSLSPMLGAMAVNEYACGRDWEYWLIWLAPAVLLFVIGWLVLLFAARKGGARTLTLSEVDGNDKEVLGFLLAYLLPVVSADTTAFHLHWQTVAYVFVILILVFSHANALHFNPVMGLLGYHFYDIVDTDGHRKLLICRKDHHRKGESVRVVDISTNISLQVPETT